MALPPNELRLRPYQHEMFDEAMHRNIIVAMDTGSGKTHIAIARIQAELERCAQDKLVWFMCPSVALAMQQKTVVEQNLSAYQVLSLTGVDGVDKWTDQRLWDAVLENVRVVISTPAILADALTHGFMKMSRLALLVFDEAHRCIKDHPMNRIMKDFYHPSKAHRQEVPFILGLSASPVMNVKHGSLATIETNLNAVATTPKQQRATLEQFVHPPQLHVVNYAPNETLLDTAPLCKALKCSVDRYDFSEDPWVLSLRQQDDEWAHRQLQKVFDSRKTYCVDQLRILCRRVEAIFDQLGRTSAESYLAMCIDTYVEHNASEAFSVVDVTSNERQHLTKILALVKSSAHVSDAQDSGGIGYCSDKAEKLLEALRRHASPSARGIVFVEQRAMVTAVAMLLQERPETAEHYKVGCFVGTSTFANRKTSIAELIDRRRNERDLEDFRNGSKNLIVATSVLEEGIDVPACNLVICFDTTKTLVAFVQRRGRARQRVSDYLLFVAESDWKSDPSRWQSLESQMKEAYMKEDRGVDDSLSNDGDDDAARMYRVASTEALLTLENAKAHLYHFCAVSTLQASSYVDLRPEFDTEEVGKKLFTATVSMPTFVHPDLRVASSSQAWQSEAAAIKDAAFEAYVALHKAQLVNNNLLPLVQDYAPDPGQMNQPSIVSVSERRSAWLAVSSNAHQHDHEWRPYEIKLTPSACSMKSTASTPTVAMTLTLLVPAVLDAFSFRLYWNERVTYTVEFDKSTQLLTPNWTMDTAQGWTYDLLRRVHGPRMSPSLKEFPVLVMPDDSARDAMLAQTSASQMNAEPRTTPSDGDGRLVYVKGQANRPYILCRITEEDAGTGEPLVTVKRFPKRADFLHQVPASDKNVAYESEQTFPLADCTFDDLPANYAVFAAFMPSIMHRIDVGLSAQELQSTILKAVSISKRELVVEAISAPAAREERDYNRLEYLGDAILKFCAHLQVMAQHPTYPEGYLTLEKGRLVSNDSLARAALDSGLDKYILTKEFTGSKWRPEYMSDVLAKAEEHKTARRDLSSKVLADVGEALVGAAYVDGGLEKAYTCIRTMLPHETWFDLGESSNRLISELPTGVHNSLGLLEQLVGHKFANPALLLEATTNASFPSNRNRHGMSYERLEFLGDAVLDLVLVPKLYAHVRRLKHWELHRAHEALVNGLYLGYCCMSYSIDEATYTIGAELGVHESARKVSLHDFIRASGEVIQAKRRCLDAYSQHRQKVQESLESASEYPWAELTAMAPAKFFSDLVESVLGALYIDTRGDTAVCEAFIEKLGILKHMHRILDDSVETAHPKERVGVLADRDSVAYVMSVKVEAETGRRIFSCVVKVAEKDIATAEASSKDEAELRAAVEATRVLEARLVAGGRKRKLDLAMKDLDDGIIAEERTEQEQLPGRVDAMRDDNDDCNAVARMDVE